jgi:FAD synthase
MSKFNLSSFVPKTHADELVKQIEGYLGRIYAVIGDVTEGDKLADILTHTGALATIMEAYDRGGINAVMAVAHSMGAAERPADGTSSDGRGRTSSVKKDEPKPGEVKKDEPKPADGPRARRLLRGKAA